MAGTGRSSPGGTWKHPQPTPPAGLTLPKALGLKVAALRLRSGFLVAVAAQSGEAGRSFGPWRLGCAVVGLGRVSAKERRDTLELTADP